MSDVKRIWVALPADGVMKPETMYGWTTDEHIAEWRSDHEADMETGGDQPLIFVEYVPAAELTRLRATVEAADKLAEAVEPFALLAETDGSLAAFAAEHPEEGGYVIKLRAALSAYEGEKG